MRDFLRINALLMAFVLLVGGCKPTIIIPGPTPGEEVVLAGTWELTGEPFDVRTFLVLNSAGIPDRLITKPASNVDVSQVLLGGESTVDGSGVEIRYSVPLSDTNQITGTLNEDSTAITGRLKTVVEMGLTTITTDLGEVTLTKVEG